MADFGTPQGRRPAAQVDGRIPHAKITFGGNAESMKDTILCYLDKMCDALRRFEWGIIYHCVTNGFHVVVKNKNMAGYMGIYSTIGLDNMDLSRNVYGHLFSTKQWTKSGFLSFTDTFIKLNGKISQKDYFDPGASDFLDKAS